MVNIEKKLINGFKRHFGNMQVSLYHAPGRTELGGNHTDHQNGQVLAAAVDMQVSAAVAGWDVFDEANEFGSLVEIYSEGFGLIELDITDLAPLEDEVGTTAALVRGVLAGLKDQGFKVGGFKAYITSDVPPGLGLSSSAAFEVLIGRIQSELYNEGSVSPV
ncbi:MAG: galactokinase, partial [Firmicutes bacterium]|nr:galactokinase [Bacillota bacterium]